MLFRQVSLVSHANRISTNLVEHSATLRIRACTIAIARVVTIVDASKVYAIIWSDHFGSVCNAMIWQPCECTHFSGLKTVNMCTIFRYDNPGSVYKCLTFRHVHICVIWKPSECIQYADVKTLEAYIMFCLIWKPWKCIQFRSWQLRSLCTFSDLGTLTAMCMSDIVFIVRAWTTIILHAFTMVTMHACLVPSRAHFQTRLRLESKAKALQQCKGFWEAAGLWMWTRPLLTKTSPAV